ncbi:hypothetical protein [Streptomyces sp. AK02-01A]|uniref:hypothetical protein n=1 Tax=Streptomyces sp. AK02-01A TaxID=3028648 RepID=UPI0029A37FBB|nr:hypothetical protein [Streptomyces sp. AK02-01A]MDX3854098.1 hypothetical protein [Streptomyces sp. AK02-01A]
MPELRSAQLRRIAQSLHTKAGTEAFASSYGMVLEGTADPAQAEPAGVGTEVLLDRAINRIFDVADRASSGVGAEDAVLDAALPLGRRVIKHLSELSDVLASSGTNVTLIWESNATARRTSFSSESAERCRSALRAAQVEDANARLEGTVVGGSKVRGVIEIEVEDGEVVVVPVPKDDVTALIATYAERQVAADVHVLTARSPGGREHRSYTLLDLFLREAADE